MKLIPERSWQPGSLGNQEVPWRDLAAVRSPSPEVRGPQDPQPTYAACGGVERAAMPGVGRRQSAAGDQLVFAKPAVNQGQPELHCGDIAHSGITG